MHEKIFLVVFDAKMKTYVDRKQYGKFLKALKREGFVLLQKSVYIKHCVGTLNLTTQTKRMQAITPSNISVITFSFPIAIFNNGGYINCEGPKLIKNRTIISI